VSKLRIVDRALEWRIAGNSRSTDRSRAYQLRLAAPRTILKHIEATDLNPREKLEARRQFLVCACAAFESYWRDTIRWIIDSLGASESLTRALNKQSFTFADLQDVLGHRLKLSELAACSYTFQHPEAVNRALSDCLSLDVFAEFAKTKFLIKEVPRKNRSSRHKLREQVVSGDVMGLRRIPEIERCFRIRHEVVHHTGMRYRPSLNEVYHLESSLWIFNDLVGMFVAERVRDLRRQHKKAKVVTRVVD
jgi:hypothetical protein